METLSEEDNFNIALLMRRKALDRVTAKKEYLSQKQMLSSPSYQLSPPSYSSSKSPASVVIVSANITPTTPLCSEKDDFNIALMARRNGFGRITAANRYLSSESPLQSLQPQPLSTSSSSFLFSASAVHEVFKGGALIKENYG